MMSMSRRLWDLDWSEVLPWRFDDVTVEYGTFEDAASFVAAHHATIFGAPDRFLVEPATPARQRFWSEMDVFVFRAEDRVVGLCAGHPTDWSTYYVRTFALLPEYQERGLLTRWRQQVDPRLVAVGVQRLECDSSPANEAMARYYAREGFIVTSMMSSERWGALLRFTRFYGDEAKSVFCRQFVAG